MINKEDITFLHVLSKDLATSNIRLPSFPDAVVQIRDALEHEDCDIRRIAELASLESVLASRLLQAANSAFYNAAGNSVSDLNAAVMRLGLLEVRNMAIALAVEQLFIAEEHAGLKKELALLWRRSIMLASVAEVLAAECSDVCREQAFLCGLLHEVGKLYMLTKASEFPGVTVDLRARSDTPDSWHPQVGRCIVENWGFDGAVVATLQPLEFIVENRNAKPELVDVVFVAELVCAATSKAPVDYDRVSAVKLKLDRDRMMALKPKMKARMDAMLATLSR